MKQTRAADLTAGLGFAVLGAFVFYLAADLQPMPRGIGPGGYPRVVGVMMVLLGLIQAAKSVAGGLPRFSLAVDPAPIVKVAAAFAAAFLYVFAVRHLGFLLLTPFLLYALLMLFGYRRYVRAAVISVAVSTVVYIVFAKIFMIFLPQFTLL